MMPLMHIESLAAQEAPLASRTEALTGHNLLSPSPYIDAGPSMPYCVQLKQLNRLDRDRAEKAAEVLPFWVFPDNRY